MSKSVKAVLRGINYAWFEYQDHTDGVMFDRGMRKLGARNLLSALTPDKTGARIVPGHPDLDIRTLSNGKVKGLIGRPSTADADFLGTWMLNPGVEKGKLTSSDTAEQADVVVFSGHGAMGNVWGDGNPSKISNTIELAQQLGRNAPNSRSGRMTYLLVPACYNLSEHNCERWTPAFKMAKPLHAILGYEDSYAGGPTGAEVMRVFTDLMKDRKDATLVQLWKQANQAVKNKQPWAVLCHPDAAGNTARDLLERNLSNLRPTSDMTFISRSVPAGKTIAITPPDFTAHWVMTDGVVIDETNNAASNSSVGLFAGKSGALRITATKGEFEKDDRVQVLIYHYRDTKDDMDINKLLTFDAKLLEKHAATGHPVVTLLVDANPQKGTKNAKRDGIEVHVPKRTKSLDLKFTVNADATKKFAADGPLGTHGLFVLAIFPPGIAAARTFLRIYMYIQGAFLR